MNKYLYGTLVILAVLTALAISLHMGLRMLSGIAIAPLAMEDDPAKLAGLTSFYGNVSIEEACYPFNWQRPQRERLKRLLAAPTTPPRGTDALSLARYAEYARQLSWEDSNYEQVVREGMRRDPQNALYHYLLAYRDVKLSIEGDWPKDAAPGTYTYTVKDRDLLDRGMEELAAGLQLPLNSRRYDLISAQLAAMPEARHLEEQIRETSVLAAVLFPEFSKMRELARVNGFYLSLLLSQNRRTKATPFLHTGERFAVQLAEDKAPTLIGSLVGLAVHAICKKNDAAVCRRYGYDAQAAEIERRYQVVSGQVEAWKNSVKDKKKSGEYDAMIRRNAGIMASILLPVFGNQRWLTPATLRTSRLEEFTGAAGLAVGLLPLLFVGLLLYSALKYWRWQSVLLVGQDAPHDITLSRGEWARVLLLGVVLPVALYALYAYIMFYRLQIDIQVALLFFALGLVGVILALLIVPTTLAANAIWRRSREAGLIEVHHRAVGRTVRGFAALLALVWSALATRSLVLLPAWLGLGLVAITPVTHNPVMLGANWIGHVVIVFILVGLALLPAIWERHHVDCAQHFLALSRAMIPVYAVLALCTGALYPALGALETHYLRHDQVITTMKSGGTLAFTKAEGRLVLNLQKMVLHGARQLEEEDTQQ